MSRTPQDANTGFIQISFRISPQTQAVIRDIADKSNLNQSEILRAALEYYHRIKTADPHLKPAMVDVTDGVDGHYAVKSWLLE